MTVMKYSRAVLAVLLIAVLSPATGIALEFDQRAKKMGLEGIAWDGTFTVYATDDELAEATLASIKKAYAGMLEQLNQRLLGKKCLVFVWKDRFKFILQASTLAGSNSISHMGGFVIRDRWKDYHALCTFESSHLHDRVLPHELAHLVLPIFLNPGKKVSIPLWLNEGYAQYQEKDSFKEAVCTVNAAMNQKKLFKIGRLPTRHYPSSYEKNQIFYDQSELLVKLLIERQNEPGDFFKLARALVHSNKGFTSILGSYYPQWKDSAALEEDFRDYITQEARRLQTDGYRSAYLKLQAAKRLQHEGDEEEALHGYAQALSDFVLIAENFRNFNPKAIQKQIEECRTGLAKTSGRKEGIKIEIGASREAVAASLGRPQRSEEGKLLYPGLELHFNEKGCLSSVEMKAPCAETLNGVSIGDPFTRVELIHGIKSPKTKFAMAQILVEKEKIISLKKLEPGSYPIIYKGKFLGQVIKLEGNDELYFIRPMGGVRSLERITLSDDAVGKLEITDLEKVKSVPDSLLATSALAGSEGTGGKKQHNFNVGDPKSKFIRYLGEPIDSGDRLIIEEKKGGGMGSVKKPALTDKYHMQYLIYDGLYVLLAANSALGIVASEPFEGKVSGIAIGDSKERVRSILGYRHYGREKVIRHSFQYENKKVTRIKSYRSKYRGKKFSF